MKFTCSLSASILALLIAGSCTPQAGEPSYTPHGQQPALIVGIMVDQMRPDLVHRFWDKFGEDGFKRLLNEGFSFDNTHFNYMPTSTGPGHGSVYTGTTPSVHGLMGNSWYVRELDRRINVIEVQGYEGVGTQADYDGNKGPGNMLTTTFGDEMRLHTNNRSKVVGISRKDRGAILPAGHTGDAYWYDGETGNFVTSTYYHEQLPTWVREFNDRNLARQYLSEPWEPLLPIEEYEESVEDNNPYERLFNGEETPTFPHNLPELVANHGYGPGILASTPFSDEMVLELALAAIEGEQLGKDPVTDLLAVSFSAVDGVGHQFGPASKEVQDTYLRLDRNLARLLDRLDESLGTENVLLFLTSDHGVSHVPAYLRDMGIPGGYFDASGKMEELRQYLIDTYGADLLLAFSNFEIFLDRPLMERNGLNREQVQKDVARFMLSMEGIAGALTAESLHYEEFTEGVRGKIQNGFHQKRSGDVIVWLEPQTLPGTGTRGSSHGSLWEYDTRAPLYWFGWNIPAGRSSHPVFITDIASTVSTFLNLPYPSGNGGQPLNEFMR